MFKEWLRKEVKAKRKSFLENEYDKVVDENKSILNKIKRFVKMHPEFDKFFVYNSTLYEVDTHQIIDFLMKTGKKVYLPRVEGDKMVAVRFDVGTRLNKGVYNIYEPIGEAEELDGFVALIPCLAVEKNGVRLGYGGGYYDKYLSGKNCLKIALAYSCQIVEEIPKEQYDIDMDIIVSGERTISRIKKTQKENNNDLSNN